VNRSAWHNDKSAEQAPGEPVSTGAETKSPPFAGASVVVTHVDAEKAKAESLETGGSMDDGHTE